jgi:hypothetical protein
MRDNFFKNCDLLHIPMSLSYKNEYFYTTYIGAFLTIICFIIIISLASYEIKTLSDKSSFTIISNQYSDLSEQIDFGKRPLLFQLIDNTGEILELDNKLYEFKAYDMEWIIEFDKNKKKNSKVVNTILELETCDKILNESNYLSDLDLSKFLCVKKGQNITSYGYLGDMNNGFKGFRIYLNKCNNRNDCYDNEYIVKKMQNIKFKVTYLGLNTNIFDLGNQNLKYQMISKACSVSTYLLKKFYFTFSIGRFNLYNNIFIKNKKVYNYIIANDPIMDIDSDPSSTIDRNTNTLAYFCFNYDGNVYEINKEVKRFIDTISIIGNAFNIILTLFKIINNYYSNKILFVDIFKSIFFSRDNNNINIFKTNQKSFFRNINGNYRTCNNNVNNLSKKSILDLSDGIGPSLNNNFSNNNLNNLKNQSSKMIMTSDKSKIPKRGSQLSINYTINKEKITNNKLLYFYLFPLWALKKHKSFNNIVLIKDKICTYFSVEKINELIKFKENLDDKARKIKVNNTELIKINKKFKDSNDSNNSINENSSIIRKK